MVFDLNNRPYLIGKICFYVSQDKTAHGPNKKIVCVYVFFWALKLLKTNQKMMDLKEMTKLVCNPVMTLFSLMNVSTLMDPKPVTTTKFCL